MAPVLIHSGLGTMLGPPQQTVFRLCRGEGRYREAINIVNMTHDGVLDSDLVPAEADCLRGDVLPLPGVQNPVCNDQTE